MQTYITQTQKDHLYEIFEHICDGDDANIARMIEPLRSLANVIDMDYRLFEKMTNHDFMSEEDVKDALEDANLESMLFDQYMRKEII